MESWMCSSFLYVVVFFYFACELIKQFQAGLFSAVSSAFIVAMQTDLQQDPNEVTHALLILLVQSAYNQTIPNQSIDSPLWHGPDRAVVLIQALSYASLSLSLLAAFGAVLGKQWLGHFKTSRFGHGTMQERGLQRHLKVMAIEQWHLHVILDALPVLLQLSLFLFGASLAANIYLKQPALGLIVLAMTTMGGVFYLWTFWTGLRHPSSPFQVGFTNLTRRAFHLVHSVLIPRGIRYPLLYLHSLANAINRLSYFIPLRIWAARFCFNAGMDLNVDIELTGSTLSVVPLSPELMSSPLTGLLGYRRIELTLQEEVGFEVVKWILETSSDPEIISLCADMLTSVICLQSSNVCDTNQQFRLRLTIDQLKYHFSACFDGRGEVLPLSAQKAASHLCAIMHLWLLASYHERWSGAIWFELNSLRSWLEGNYRRMGQFDETSQHAVSAAWRFINTPLFGADTGNLYHRNSYKVSSTVDWLTRIIPYEIIRRESPEWLVFNCTGIWSDILSPSSERCSQHTVANILFGMATILGYKNEMMLTKVDKT